MRTTYYVKIIIYCPQISLTHTGHCFIIHVLCFVYLQSALQTNKPLYAVCFFNYANPNPHNFLRGEIGLTHLNYCCVSVQLDLIWPHATLKGNQGLGNFHLPSIDCGSCRDMEKPIPLLPFIGPIKNSSCPNGKRSFSVSPLQTNCV